MAALQMVDKYNNFLPALRKIGAVPSVCSLPEAEHVQHKSRLQEAVKLPKQLLAGFVAVPLFLSSVDTQAVDFSPKQGSTLTTPHIMKTPRA